MRLQTAVKIQSCEAIGNCGVTQLWEHRAAELYSWGNIGVVRLQATVET